MVAQFSTITAMDRHCTTTSWQGGGFRTLTMEDMDSSSFTNPEVIR